MIEGHYVVCRACRAPRKAGGVHAGDVCKRPRTVLCARCQRALFVDEHDNGRDMLDSATTDGARYVFTRVSPILPAAG